MKKLSLFLLLLIVPFQTVFAEELVMYVDQSEYYYKIGENAVIPLEIENDYGRQISGMLQYTITQQIMQANKQFLSSNTQASTFIISDGDQIVSLDFGTSSSPTTLTVNLNFIYDDGNQMNVSFDPITINFVSDESQKNNKQNRMQSSSQQGSTSQNNSPNQQQSLQQQIEELMNQQSSQIQDPQQRLQNNQLAQDSNTLKKEIQQQLQEENTLKQEFQKQLVSNDDFQKSHQELLQQGYNATSAKLNPSSELSGDFEVSYENEQGKWAKIKGNMVNGTLTDLQRQTQEEQDGLLSKLREDLTFQEYERQLVSEGFVEQSLEFIFDKNMTSILLEYQNEEFQIATINAEFDEDELIKINLKKPERDYSYLLYFLGILPILIAAYFLYKKLKTKKKVSLKPIIQKSLPKKFDYILASNNLIIQAKENFEKKQHKKAYGKINQAIRLFLSYELKLNKELTNEEILLHLTNTKYPITDIENCFKLSSLVEFAKNTPNEDEFYKMITLAENLFHIN